MIVAEPPVRQTPQEQRPALQMVYCHNCRRPVGRAYLTPGSVVEFKCRSCGEKHLELGAAG